MSQCILLREKQTDRDREIEDVPDEKTSLDQQEFLCWSKSRDARTKYLKTIFRNTMTCNNVQ